MRALAPLVLAAAVATPAFPQAAATPQEMHHLHGDPMAYIVALDDPVPALGTMLDLVPGQIRTTTNLHDWIWVSRGGQIVDRWPVTARGRSW